MATRKRLGRKVPPVTAQPVPRAGAAVDVLLHPQTHDERPWKYVLWVLAMAFAARAAVALSGDFVLHPDEIMQYLEPAHRLAFGNGVIYWEYFYGARSWIVPGAIAGILKLFDAVGLGQPFWYVGGVKLALCALSLVIPASMYVFARRHFGENTARVALVAGAFWYELAGFAHKPMTEFVAAAPLLGLLALCVRRSVDDTRSVWLAAFLAVMATAARMQYAPLSAVLLGVVFVRTGKKMQIVLAAAGFALVVGIFDAVTWDGGLFHSYITNLRFNLHVDPLRVTQPAFYQYLWWLLLAGGGLSALCLATALCGPRRYGFVIGLIVLTLLVHSLAGHKEYRFVFLVIPLWLLIGADLVTRIAARAERPGRLTGLAAAVFAAVSFAGILNALPYQQRVYRAWSSETEYKSFVRNQDPAFRAYRYLARAPGVTAVWHVDRHYYALPGYYYLHRSIPLYDQLTAYKLIRNPARVPAMVSHIVSTDPKLTAAGYSLEREFGDIRILRRDATEPPVRDWRHHTPVMVGDRVRRIMRSADPDAPKPPPNAGIRFTDPRPDLHGGRGLP